jgi:hypothetical protein
MVCGPKEEEQIMPQKRYRPKEIIAKLREVEVLLDQGKKVPEIVKVLGIHEVTYYRWRRRPLAWPAVAGTPQCRHLLHAGLPRPCKTSRRR